MYERGLTSQALKLALTAVRVCEVSNQECRLLLADCWTTIGGVQIETHSATDSATADSYNSLKTALDLRLQAVTIGLMNADHPQIANSFMSLSSAALGLSVRSSSTDPAREAVELAKKSIGLREKNPTVQEQMHSLSYHNLALAHLQLCELGEAEEAATKGLEIARNINPSTGATHTMYFILIPLFYRFC